MTRHQLRNLAGITLLSLIGSTGCLTVEIEPAQIPSVGRHGTHQIQLFSGDWPRGEWTSTAEPVCGDYNSFCTFANAETGKQVRISGNIIITEQ